MLQCTAPFGSMVHKLSSTAPSVAGTSTLSQQDIATRSRACLQPPSAMQYKQWASDAGPSYSDCTEAAQLTTFASFLAVRASPASLTASCGHKPVREERASSYMPLQAACALHETMTHLCVVLCIASSILQASMRVRQMSSRALKHSLHCGCPPLRPACGPSPRPSSPPSLHGPLWPWSLSAAWLLPHSCAQARSQACSRATACMQHGMGTTAILTCSCRSACTGCQIKDHNMTLRSTAACMLAYLGPSGSLHMCCRILCLHQQVCAQKGAFSHTVPVCDTWLTWPPAALWCSLPVALWSFSAALWASLSSLCPTTAPFTLAAVSCAGGRLYHPGSPLLAACAGAAPQLTLTFAVTPVIAAVV